MQPVSRHERAKVDQAFLEGYLEIEISANSQCDLPEKGVLIDWHGFPEAWNLADTPYLSHVTVFRKITIFGNLFIAFDNSRSRPDLSYWIQSFFLYGTLFAPLRTNTFQASFSDLCLYYPVPAQGSFGKEVMQHVLNHLIYNPEE